MRLQVLQTQGLPPNSVLSVKSGSSRRQQLLPCQAPFKVDQPPVPVQLDVLTYAAKGQEVLPDPSEQFLKVPLSKGGRNMSAGWLVTLIPAAKETGQSAEMSRKDKERLLCRSQPCGHVRRPSSEADRQLSLNRISPSTGCLILRFLSVPTLLRGPLAHLVMEESILSYHH
ncbi:HET-E1 [Symbiodinium natans]|uniref:HET-E1 protein n=1 Tax=Symbiodinium natans TaxID=878477 RepID=A0A812GQV9_9DINO|nr:HET-E1 [Symbiodinium natans]